MWKKVHGCQAEKPLAIDTTSSEYFVYLRQNIEFVEGEWVYDEKKVSKAEYAQMRAEELEEELTQTQLALTEIYESVVANNG